LVTPDDFSVQGEGLNKAKGIERFEDKMELATGIEPATCGLQIRVLGIAQTPLNMGNPLALPT
jgi:hypothetical protein